MTQTPETDFDDWLLGAYAATGAFTLLIVLVTVGDTTVEAVRSTHLHVIGDEVRWPDMVALFAGAGVSWSGAVFFRAGREGLVEDPEAKARLRALTRKIHEDRTLIQEGDFFNADGLRLRLEPLTTH